MKLESTNRSFGASRLAAFGTIVAGLALILMAMLPGAGIAGAVEAQTPEPSSNITITQQNDSNQPWLCLPGWMTLTRTIHNTPEYFELVIKANNRPCEPIKATAAIYGMPGSGVAWPQTLKETKTFTISKAGTTRVRFAKTCDPVQFDVIAGIGSSLTPPVISPTGPWHGPLLFTFDTATSYQHWGCKDTTTTSTDPCENYSARQLAVMPNPVNAGSTVTVSGLGTPGTTLAVWLSPRMEPDPQAPEPAPPTPVSVVVPPSGAWSVEIVVPADAQPGPWSANAQASDCEAVASVDFTVTEVASGGDGNGEENPTIPGDPVDPSTPGGSDNPVVDPSGPSDSNDVDTEVHAAVDAQLPPAAVQNVALSDSVSRAAANDSAVNATKLAWTGSNVRIPLITGATLLIVGVLLVLRTRRSAHT